MNVYRVTTRSGAGKFKQCSVMAKSVSLVEEAIEAILCTDSLVKSDGESWEITAIRSVANGVLTDPDYGLDVDGDGVVSQGEIRPKIANRKSKPEDDRGDVVQ